MNPLEATLSPRACRAMEVIRRVLAVAGLPQPDMRQIIFTARSIREFSFYEGLSHTILDYDFPKLNGTEIVDHYTTSAGFKGIMSTRELWLAPITLRLTQYELSTFALVHGLNGYVDENGAPKPALTQAAADLFYTSFTQCPPSDHLWEVFGDCGNGYRLRFEVTTGGSGQVRAIRYDGGTTLLRQINDALVQAELPRFIPKQISRVGAFYLPLVLNPENEIRLLTKRFRGGGAPTIIVGESERWPIPIGSTNRTADLKLVEIGVRCLDMAIVKSKLPVWCANLPVVTDLSTSSYFESVGQGP